MPQAEELPLLYETPADWADSALRDPLRLLNDHAHLEKKAASNALDMLLRWPNPNPPENWVQAMTSIAIDEVSHLQTVTRILSRRGGRLTQWHANPYANDLRRLIRKGDGTREIMDRLMISSLIEARSCERFYLLGQHCADKELAKLYKSLYKSEAGHYRIFLTLARSLPKKLDIEGRWREMLEAESDIIQAQPPGPAMHSGVS